MQISNECIVSAHLSIHVSFLPIRERRSETAARCILLFSNHSLRTLQAAFALFANEVVSLWVYEYRVLT